MKTKSLDECKSFISQITKLLANEHKRSPYNFSIEFISDYINRDINGLVKMYNLTDAQKSSISNHAKHCIDAFCKTN